MTEQIINTTNVNDARIGEPQQQVRPLNQNLETPIQINAPVTTANVTEQANIPTQNTEEIIEVHNQRENMSQTLYEMYKLINRAQFAVEKPIFNIKLTGTKFLKYLDQIDGTGTKLYTIHEILDTFKSRTAERSVGVKIGINNNDNTLKECFIRPSAYNFTVILRADGPNQYVRLNAQEWGTYPGSDYMGDDLKAQMILQRRWAQGLINQHVQQFDINSQAYTALNMGGSYGYYVDQGGDRWYGLNLRIGLKRLNNQAASYIDAKGKDFENINIEAEVITSLFRQFRYSDLRTSNNQFKKLIEYLYNVPVKSILAYNPLIYQLKLFLYLDAFNTLYDMVENYNSGNSKQLARMIAPRYNVVENVNPYNTMNDGREFKICWATLEQMKAYERNRLEAAVVMRDDYEFVPIKYDVFRDDDKLNKIMTYVVALAPYPIVNAVGEAVQIRSQADLTQNSALFSPDTVILEHNSSKIFIEGHKKICFVIVDFPEDVETNPQQQGYPQAMMRFDLPNIQPALVIDMPNLIHANLQGNNPDWEGFLRAYVVRMVRGTQNHMLAPLIRLREVTGWEIYSCLYNIVASLTTVTSSVFANGFEHIDLIHAGGNVETCSFVPYTNAEQMDKHLMMQEPDFQQKAFALVGFVKQRGAMFMYDLDLPQFSRMMYATRLIMADCKADFLQNKRNEVPLAINVINDPIIHALHGNRRKEASELFNKTYFEYSEIFADLEMNMAYQVPAKYLTPANLQQGAIARHPDWRITEYCNVEDWAVLMQTELDAPEKRICYPDTKSLEQGDLIIDRSAQWSTIMGIKGNRSNCDSLRHFLNNTYGRSLQPAISNAICTRWETAFPTRANYNLFQNTMVYEPIWNITLFGWCAIIGWQWPKLEYYSDYGPMVVNLGTQNQNLTAVVPFVRCLDYVYPQIDWDTNQPMTMMINNVFLNEVLPYTIILPWKMERHTTVETYDYRPVYMAFNIGGAAKGKEN